MKIAVDFDGTIVEHKYPYIGKEIPFAFDTLKRLQEENHRLILWTVREGRLLEEAIEYCRQKGLEFYAINQDEPDNVPVKSNRISRKLKVDVFIDDRNIGGLPDWGMIYEMLTRKVTYEDLLKHSDDDYEEKRHRGFFSRLFGRR